jgi:hypothetical protein
VQEQGCAALWQLCTCPATIETVARAGGVEVALTAMLVHGDCAGVQEHACGALRALAVEPVNAVAIAATGGIEAVVDAMRRHADAPGVQAQGCAVMWNMALCGRDIKDAIIRCGGRDVLCAARRLTASADGALQALAGPA